MYVTDDITIYRLPLAIFTKIFVEIRIFAFKEIFARIAAVSYTHLDVYKRQEVALPV